MSKRCYINQHGVIQHGFTTGILLPLVLPASKILLKNQETETYIDGLCIKIGAPTKPATSKRNLIDLLDEGQSESTADEEPIAECSKNKKYMYSDSDIEDDVSSVLRHTSISNKVFEPLEAEETLSKVKIKKKEKKRNQKENRQMIIGFFISFLSFSRSCVQIY